MKFLTALILFCWFAVLPGWAKADLHVSGFFTNNVLRTGDAGGTLGTFIGSSTPGGNGGLSGPVGMTINPLNNDFLVASQGTGHVKRYNALTGVYLGDFATALSAPSGMLLGKNNDILVTSYASSGAIYRFAYDGTPLASIIGGGLNQAAAAIYGSGVDNHLYVASYGTGEVLQYSYSNTGGGTYTFASVFTKNMTGNSAFDLGSPGGLTFHNGKLYVSELEGPDNGRIMVYNGLTGEFESVFATISGGFPAMIDFLDDGSALVALTGSNRVVQIPPTGGSGPINSFTDYASGFVGAPGAFLFATVPEPGTWAALFLVAGGGVRYYRRRRSASL